MKHVFAGLCAVGLASSLTGCFDTEAKVPYDAAECQRLIDQFTESNMAAGLSDRPGNLVEAIGQTGRAVVRIKAMEEKLRAHGCPVGFRDDAGPMKPAMAEARDASSPSYQPQRPEPPQLGTDPEPTTQLDGY